MKFPYLDLHCSPCVLFVIIICLFISCRQDRSSDNSLSASSPKEQVIQLDTVRAVEEADSLYLVGEKYIEHHQNDSSLIIHSNALALREKIGMNNRNLAESYFRVAWLYLEDYKYDIADPLLERARITLERSNENDQGLYIEIFLNAADCKANLMDIASAISLIVKAQSLILKHFPDDHFLLARCYHIYSACYYYDKQYNKAIELIKKSIDIIPISNHKKRSVEYVALGSFYKESKKNAEALYFYNKSIEENLKWTDLNSNEIAFVYLQKATVLYEIGQKDSARYFLIKNLEIRRKIFGNKNVNTFGALLTLANFEYSEGLFVKSARHFQESLISLIRNFNDPQLSSNPNPEPTELNSDLIMGLAGKAKALRMMSLTDSSSTSLKELAIDTYFLADSVFRTFRSISNYDDPILKQLETGYIPYDKMAALAFELFNVNHKTKYAELAMNIMERSRAVLVQNSLQKAEAYNLTGVPSTFREREKVLTRQRTELQRNLSASDLTERASDSLNNALLILDGKFSEFYEELKQNNPLYFSSKFQAPKVLLRDLQFFLKSQHSTLLEYLWNDSAIYLLQVTPNDVKASVIHQTPEFRSAFHDFTMEVKVGEESTIKMERFVRFCNSAHLLYKELISKSMEQMPPNTHVIISADGPLSIFPFEALIKDRPNFVDVNYHLPYLMLDYSISYTYSSSLLLNRSEKSRHGNKLLAFGFAGNGPSREKRKGFVNLPGTKLEIEAIKEVMKNHTNKYFLENEASEFVFKNSINAFNVAHLALHGVSDTLNALESRIIFRSENDSIEDGQLYWHELYDLDLSQLDLAVLSACESGLGKHQIGEGVMSMARGFAYAGCPSLVMSLWKLDDKTSAKVMSDFYRHLSVKEDIDVALTEAKRNYLANAKEFTSHPSFWAAFIAVGNTEPLYSETFNWKTWLILLGLFLLIAGLLRKYLGMLRDGNSGF